MTSAPEFVRRYYNVPAKRGMRVEFEGRPGVITGFRDQYLLVRLDQQVLSYASKCHPTWHMDYLDGKGQRS